MLNFCDCWYCKFQERQIQLKTFEDGLHKITTPRVRAKCFLFVMKRACNGASSCNLMFVFFSHKVKYVIVRLFSACFLPRDPGPCNEEILRYHYNSNPTVKDCVGFIYGGCRGNANNFGTLEECISQCRDKVSLRTTAKTKKDKEVKVSKRIPGCTGEHGCCDDYVTPAKGPNQEGCPGKAISFLFV